ncbi:S-layer family protein [Coleofasciculus sp. FACHB-712]|nr:S-layer family protein [Coleofasciculus sp. FACHB-712]MBD1944070.1 S-layer family protein [Coleofasciculus sp. FACHB-712]
MGLVSGLAISGAIASFGNCVLAQLNLTPDAAPESNLGTQVEALTPLVDQIQGGTQHGNNLFHSFSEFNVGEGRSVYFENPDGVTNILSRVTGNDLSDILGTLGVGAPGALGTANLFLINPNGIIFGPNACLDVGGSFVATTADSVVFDNGFAFSATNSQAPPLLTINVPLGLQFGANPGSIVNQSVDGLEVQPGKTLALVGSEVAIEGGVLKAPDGRIELGSVAGNHQVSLTPTNTGYSLDYGGVEEFQDIRLSQAAFVSTSGNSGGSIQVQGRNVMLIDGSSIAVVTLGAGTGEDLTVNASESVQLIGTSANGRTPSGLSAQTYERGEAGSLTINTPVLLVSDGAQVSTSTFAEGAGGSLMIINASKSVQLIGTSANGRTPSGLFASTTGTGEAGDLTINTPVLLVSDGAQVSTSTFAEGAGGSLMIINASKSVQLIGTSANGQTPSGLFASTTGTGEAGDLTINTPVLLVSDGAQVSTSTFAEGAGGSLIVNASELVQLIGTSANGRTPSGLFARTQGAGEAGDLTITTPQLLISDGAQATVSSFGEGVAGNLSITADSVHLDNGKILAQTLSADGGNLELHVTDLLLLRNDSEISTTAGTDQKGGDGGNITIDIDFIVAVPSEDSDITANAFSGRGGNIDITATGIYGTEFREQRTPESDITASSEFGVDGVVEINTPDVDPSRGLAELPAVPVDTGVAQGCSPGGSQAQSEFIITGRGGLPPNPGEALSTDAVQVDLVTLNPRIKNRSIPNISTNRTRSTPVPLVEAQGWVRGANGKVVLTANAPTVTPHRSWQRPPECSALQSNPKL